MKVVVQRVMKASCTVDGKVVSKIGQGFLLLVGFCVNDKADLLPKIVKKVAGLRIFEDEEHKLNRSINDINGEILSISQFTLYASMKKGNRPSFTDAMPGAEASLLYQAFNKSLAEACHIEVKEGVFGADMKLDFVNDGPCTIILDSLEL